MYFISFFHPKAPINFHLARFLPGGALTLPPRRPGHSARRRGIHEASVGNTHKREYLQIALNWTPQRVRGDTTKREPPVWWLSSYIYNQF